MQLSGLRISKCAGRREPSGEFTTTIPLTMFWDGLGWGFFPSENSQSHGRVENYLRAYIDF
jgi:hypothetical protein